MSTTLPDKLSCLLRLSVADAQRCEADPQYVLNMLLWHQTRAGEPRCQVCMAGAIMAQTLGTDPHEEESVTWNRLEAAGLDEKLMAVNDMRNGDFSFDVGLPGDLSDEQFAGIGRARSIIKEAFQEGLRRAPWATYLEAADILEGVGL